MAPRRVANTIAVAVFVVLLLAGVNVVAVAGPSFDPPTKFAKVTETSRGVGGGKLTRSVERDRTPPSRKLGSKVTRTVERPVNVPPSQKITRTEEEQPRSFVERVLGKSGLIGIQVAIVVLASFLFAAMVQKALIGDFSIKIGSLVELGLAQEAPTMKLTNELASLQKSYMKKLKVLEPLSANFEQLNRKTEALGRLLAEQKAVGDANTKQIATLKRIVVSSSRRSKKSE